MSREEPVIEGGVEGGGSPRKEDTIRRERRLFVERRPSSREEVVRRLRSGTWMWWEGRKEEQWISALGNSKVNMIT